MSQKGFSFLPVNHANFDPRSSAQLYRDPKQNNQMDLTPLPNSLKLWELRSLIIDPKNKNQQVADAVLDHFLALFTYTPATYFVSPYHLKSSLSRSRLSS